MPAVKMLPTFKEAWVKALRSNKYKQTSQMLRNKNGFCCLGVACDIGMEMGLVKGKWGELDSCTGSVDFIYNDSGEERGADIYLPSTLAEAINISEVAEFDWTEERPKIQALLKDKYDIEIVVTEINSLASLNDSAVPFAAIADVIEEFF